MKPSAAYPIAPILRALGGENIPDIYGSGYIKIRCPFHGPDRTPSASVSRYGFRCFTCGRTGDALKLLREEESLTFEDAISRAEEITGGTDPAVAPAGQPNRGLLDI